ncbi:MAG: class I SAM-dependent methyltransferase [Chlamydiae bacterium]|nr:class I SAM-dependent methyltransferase [Chlamydiota bacterium]
MSIRSYLSFVLCLFINGVYAHAAKHIPISNESAFGYIYENGVWGCDENGHGNSGTGSDPKNTTVYISFLQQFLADHQIASVVDLGCGDFRLGRCICWDGIDYIGIDVVDSLLNTNIENFSASNISFALADGVNYPLPAADLLICKDVLQHLPFGDIHKIINQFKKFKYCLIINDVDPITLTCKNKDIARGGYRQLDLTKRPFRLSGHIIFHYISDSAKKQVLLINNRA